MLLPRNDDNRWARRIARARELAEEYPAALEILTFYAHISAFQQCLTARLKAAIQENKAKREDAAFGEYLDLTPLVVHFPSLLSLVRRVGTPFLAQAAEELARCEAAYWEHLLSTYAEDRTDKVVAAPATHIFLARVLLQPCAELAASRMGVELPHIGSRSCPVCSGKPQVGVLREDGQAARRSLICAFCYTEWGYRRLVCPACGEERFDSLPVYTANQFEHVRVEACDTCNTYIKTVDLTKNGLAVPEVDELATLTLSLWAQEKGYKKLHSNLFGI